MPGDGVRRALLFPVSSVILYFIPFLIIKKDVFHFFPKDFSEFFQENKGHHENMCRSEQNFRQPAETEKDKPAQRAEINDAAAHNSDQHEQAQLSVADQHGKLKERGGGQQPKKHVQKSGGKTGAAPYPESAQEIVKNSQTQPKRDGAGKLEQLLRYRLKHTQRKRRENRPPRSAASSS